jgi:protein phosphatase methylesterase 1
MLDETIPIYYAGSKGHVFLCLHGAGHSAQSFAALAKLMKEQSTVVSFDFRGHGGHYRDDETEMSQANLIEDTIYIIKHVAAKYPTQSIILVGHSMGGSIATKTFDHMEQNKSSYPELQHIKGLFIIDVVEGSAMDALPFMESIVSSRPQQFSSV